MYKLQFNNLVSAINGVIRIEDNAFIPFDPANTDYQKFKDDLLAGAELQDVDGNVMNSEAVTSFFSTLP